MLLSKYKKLGLILCGVSMIALSACSQKAPKEEMPAAEVNAPVEMVDTTTATPPPVIEEAPLVTDITPPPAPVVDEPSNSGKTSGVGVKYHTVKKGETLYSIAKKYGTTTKKLLKWNGLKSAKALKVGNKLKVRM